MKQVIQGNDHAFRILIEKYQNDIYKLVFSVLRNEKDAEDGAQEVFVKIYYSLPNYEGKGLKTWISRIAINHAIDLKRKRDRKREDVTEDNIIQFKAPASETVEDEILRKEKQKRVQDRLSELPPNYHDVVYGYYIQEKSSQQLAAELDVKEKTILVKLHRARKWMKQRWKEEDF